MRYWIDADDRIDSVSSEWLGFAHANGADGLTPNAVVGRPLWDFITGMETRHLYELLLQRIRERGSRVVLAFRCDAPELRRFMEVEITGLSGGRVEFDVQTVRAEEREEVGLLDLDRPRGQDLVTVCSWCKMVLHEDGSWLEIEDAIARLGLFCADPLPRLTHGACPRCEQRVQREIDAMDGVR